MKRAFILLLWLGFSGAFPGAALAAKDVWPPIPPEVWALRDTAGQEGMGAVILNKRVQLTSMSATYQYRIRIFSERGLAAAKFRSFPAGTSGLEGRVVFPDGRELAFNSERDFHAKTLMASRFMAVKETILVPPGLTDNCVVDLRWQELRYWRVFNYLGRGAETWDLPEAYPISTLTLEIAKNASFNWYFQAGRDSRGSKDSDLDYTIYTLTDVPALERISFSLTRSRDIPRLRAHVMGENLTKAAKKGKSAFWDEVAAGEKKVFDGNFILGKAFRDLSKSLREGLPQAPQALAKGVLLRLHGRISNFKDATHADIAQETEKDMALRLSPRDLESACVRGTAQPESFTYLLYQVLMDAGLKPKLALVANREQGRFNPEELNSNQFHAILLGIDEPGQSTLWLDALTRCASPGLILPGYQGTQAMAIDPATWQHKLIQLPIQPPAFNRRVETYALELAQDQDHFTYEAGLSGMEAFLARNPVRAFENKEKSAILKEALEADFGTVAVDRVEVTHATDFQQPLGWKVEGRVERAVGRHRIVEPFPLSHAVLAIPDDLEVVRSLPIVLPYLQERVAIARFKVPPGFRWRGTAPVSWANDFGFLRFKVEPAQADEGAEVVATLEGAILSLEAPASQWAQFRDYLGWLRKGQTFHLVLEAKP